MNELYKKSLKTEYIDSIIDFDMSDFTTLPIDELINKLIASKEKGATHAKLSTEKEYLYFSTEQQRMQTDEELRKTHDEQYRMIKYNVPHYEKVLQSYQDLKKEYEEKYGKGKDEEAGSESISK